MTQNIETNKPLDLTKRESKPSKATKAGETSNFAGAAVDTADVATDFLIYNAAGDLAVDVVGAVVDVAGSALSVVGDVVGGTAEVVGDVIGGIFSALD